MSNENGHVRSLDIDSSTPLRQRHSQCDTLEHPCRDHGMWRPVVQLMFGQGKLGKTRTWGHARGPRSVTFWPTTPVRLLCYKVILLVRKSIVALFSICTQAGLERAKFFSSWSEILFEKSGFAGWCELVICKYGPNRLMIGEFKVGKVPRNQTLLHQTEAVWLRWHDDRYGEVAG